MRRPPSNQLIAMYYSSVAGGAEGAASSGRYLTTNIRVIVLLPPHSKKPKEGVGSSNDACFSRFFLAFNNNCVAANFFNLPGDVGATNSVSAIH